nr:ankyrin repeat domain-containing protein [Capnocytophaga sp. oral taxon 878]
MSFQVVMDIFLKYGANINQKQEDKQFGYSLLHLAVITKNLEAFNYLIEKGADVNAQDINGNSILSSAVFNYNRDTDFYTEIINKLIEKGANIYLENNYGVSAYSLANNIASDVKKFFQ